MCLGLGWVRSGDYQPEHPEFGRLVRCTACGEGMLSSYLRAASGLTGWQLQARFAGYVETEERATQLAAAQALVKRGHGWLALWGGFGVGKSYLLAAIVNEVLALKRPAVYITAGRLLDHLRDAYAPGAIGFSAAFTNWASCQVLAIDEADTFHDTAWAMDKYRQLLEQRYNLACAGDSVTVFASNPRPGSQEWPEALRWLASRMGQFEVIEARGGDMRPVLGKADGYRPWEEKYD